MQKLVHPQTTATVIRCKDGSFFLKHWLYFRDALQLETDVTSNTIWTVRKRYNYDDINNGVEKLYNFNAALLPKKK